MGFVKREDIPFDQPSSAILSIMNEKDIIRTAMRSRRDLLSPSLRVEKDALINKHLIESVKIHFQNNTMGNPCVAVYASMRSEVNLEDFVQFAYTQSWVVCFPFLTQDSETLVASMNFFAVPHSLYLNARENTLRNPLQKHTANSLASQGFSFIKPSRLDVIVAPLVAYNNSNHRLGYGGGNYDRYLPNVRSEALVVGVAYCEQQNDSLPIEPHDQALAYIITA